MEGKTMKKQVIKELIEIANSFDKKGLRKEADAIDRIVRSAATCENEKEIGSLVKKLEQELPGITFGYLGNTGVDRSGNFDDRTWYVFLPHRQQKGAGDSKDTVPVKGKSLEQIEKEVRRLYALEQEGRKHTHEQTIKNNEEWSAKMRG